MTARRILLALVAWLLPSLASASSFTVVSVQNEIKGEIGGGDGFFLPLNQDFDFISNGAISNTVHDTNVYGPDSGAFGRQITGFSSASADMASVAVSIDQTRGGAETVAEAINTVDFTPNFAGDLDGILFYGTNPAESWFAAPRALWTITDLTTDTLLASEVPDVRGDFSQDLHSNSDGVTTPITITWNPSDVYELQLMEQVGSNGATDGGTLTTNLFAINVPEPATLALFAIGLGVVIIGRRRRLTSAR